MAKEKLECPISSVITPSENEKLNEADEYLTESRSSFIRRVVMREVDKILQKKKDK